MRAVHTEPPADTGERDGLSYALFLPAEAPAGGVVVLHGAGSQKENHFDFARACRAAGLAAVAFDQRGHGASDGALDGRAIDDVATIAALLPDGAPVALRGSSMGGWLALAAGAALDAAAVVAICPASGGPAAPRPRRPALPVPRRPGLARAAAGDDRPVRRRGGARRAAAAHARRGRRGRAGRALARAARRRAGEPDRGRARRPSPVGPARPGPAGASVRFIAGRCGAR